MGGLKKLNKVKATLASKGKKVGKAMGKAANKVMASIPVDNAKFKCILICLLQLVPAYIYGSLGTAHAIWATTPTSSLTIAFMGIGITAGLLVIMMLVFLVLICIRIKRGGHQMMHELRSLIVMYVCNFILFVIGTGYIGLILMCKSVQYGNTEVCITHYTKSIASLEIIMACIVIIKEGLYYGFECADMRHNIIPYAFNKHDDSASPSAPLLNYSNPNQPEDEFYDDVDEFDDFEDDADHTDHESAFVTTAY